MFDRGAIESDAVAIVFQARRPRRRAARTALVERNETVSLTSCQRCPASATAVPKWRAVVEEQAGSAPWKLKIDCLTSPTAKTVRAASLRPAPEKNSAGQRPDDAPLLGAGVLRLVDEDVIDAAVELVQDPGRAAALFQQIRGALDQVIVIEAGARRLVALVGREQGLGRAISTAALVSAQPAARRRARSATMRWPRPASASAASGACLRAGLGHERRADLVLAGQETRAIGVERLDASRGIGGEPIGQHRATLPILAPAGQQRLRGRAQGGAVESVLLTGVGKTRASVSSVPMPRCRRSAAAAATAEPWWRSAWISRPRWRRAPASACGRRFPEGGR